MSSEVLSLSSFWKLILCNECDKISLKILNDGKNKKEVRTLPRRTWEEGISLS